MYMYLPSHPPPSLPSSQACDHRSQTALLAAFRNGHVELVDWLLGHVAHLPSEQDCQKALLAPSPPSTDLTPQRARCLEKISKVSSLSPSSSPLSLLLPPPPLSPSSSPSLPLPLPPLNVTYTYMYMYNMSCVHVYIRFLFHICHICVVFMYFGM